MRCYNCMETIPDHSDVCPNCGYVLSNVDSEVYHLKKGTMLQNRYSLGIVIGFGGFGIVYKAWDNKLNRMVAIKEYFPTIFLKRGDDGKTTEIFDEKNREAFEHGKEEFLQEARNIAKFNMHPNIVHIYDYFTENGTAYFVMEYLTGHNLKDYILEGLSQGKVFTVKSALYVAEGLLNALEATHKEGIIHRDIKPGNIYILKDGTVKLFDFGAARFSDSENELTRTVIITPGYAPPEQYQIKSKQGPYTDIYAVGAILYEMLTGIKLEESINRKVSDELPVPSYYNTNIPGKLDNVIMRALAVKTEIRFNSVVDFKKALLQDKRIRGADAEVRHRKRIRNLIIATSSLLVLGLVMYSGWSIFSKYRKANLAPASIEIWVTSVSGDVEKIEEQYEEMASEFLINNSDIDLNIRVIDQEVYIATLTKALSDGTAPTMFERVPDDGVEESFLADISSLYEEPNFDISDYYFLDDYSEYFIDKRKIPLLFEVPIVYENSINTDLEDGSDYEAYVEKKANYKGTTLDYERVQNDMPGVYTIREELDGERHNRFLKEWSINNNSKQAEKAAAIRLIYYFLSDNSQQLLSIDNNEGLPLNKDVWNLYIEINNDFSFLTKKIEEMSFVE